MINSNIRILKPDQLQEFADSIDAGSADLSKPIVICNSDRPGGSCVTWSVESLKKLKSPSQSEKAS